jgi:hypothetical protein
MALPSSPPRSPKGRNAAVTGTVAFPVLDGYGDTGLSVMELPCRGLLTVPSLANFVWGPEVTITAYVARTAVPCSL